MTVLQEDMLNKSAFEKKVKKYVDDWYSHFCRSRKRYPCRDEMLEAEREIRESLLEREVK